MICSRYVGSIIVLPVEINFLVRIHVKYILRWRDFMLALRMSKGRVRCRDSLAPYQVWQPKDEWPLIPVYCWVEFHVSVPFTHMYSTITVSDVANHLLEVSILLCQVQEVELIDIFHRLLVSHCMSSRHNKKLTFQLCLQQKFSSSAYSTAHLSTALIALLRPVLAHSNLHLCRRYGTQRHCRAGGRLRR